MGEDGARGTGHGARGKAQGKTKACEVCGEQRTVSGRRVDGARCKEKTPEGMGRYREPCPVRLVPEVGETCMVGQEKF